MENKKQYLINKEEDRIKKLKEEIKESDGDLEMMEVELKVDKKFFEMKDIDEIREDVKYFVMALESEISSERDRNEMLKKDLKIALARRQVINKFEEDEL